MLRVGTDADISLIAEMEKQIFSDPWQKEDIADFLVKPHLRLFVWVEEKRVLGYLLGSVIAPEGEIYRVAVLPEARRHGAGAALCGALFYESDTVYLEVRRGNSSARALYEKLGFTLMGERKNYYKNPTEDACLYRWEKVLCE